MIPAASMSTTQQIISDKSSDQKTDQPNAAAFIELLNQLKNGTGSNTAQDLFSPILAVETAETEPAQEESQEMREDLLGLIFTQPDNLTELQTKAVTAKDQVPFVQNKEPNIQKPAADVFKSIEKMAQVQENPNQQQTVEKSGTNQTAVTNLLKPGTESTSAQQPIPKFENEFDFQRQFHGKEVIFQSLHTPGQEPEQTSTSQSSKITREQFVTEVIGLLKHHTKSTELMEAKFSLTPEHLGEIDVKITIEKGQVFAQITAETAHGKEMLESQVSVLKTALQQQGFQIDKIEIAQSESSGQMPQSGFSQPEGKSGQEQHQRRFANKKPNRDEFYQSHTTIDTYLHKGSETSINILA
ncbi:flagellar hook-length control protein FliK [Neobacillus niacini]|uniref:flagellar hook-length control protein FliK n=1 Tax=Neobacillus niacini TaxID=86668 RepID=UPI0021CB127D|nr:flagellar hook-length control protein FliK [Neobacillus niacini]MCM3763597.1 flagellar hook-length control protein FliK [Neobacillus niacini]